MSDWLLLGVDPKNPEGKELYLHTMEEWSDIVSFVDWSMGGIFPINDRAPLAYLEQDQAEMLADLIEVFLTDEILVRRLKRGQWYLPTDCLVASLRGFSRFLKVSGGFVTELGKG